jgi:epoxyqueuosine reductase
MISAPAALLKEASLASRIKAEAHRLGFELAGVAPAVTPTGIHELLEWLDHGYAGDMAYIERREEAYAHPRSVLDGVRSIVMLGINYNTGERGPSEKGGETASVVGRVARYAQGREDYHDVIRRKLRELGDFVQRESPDARCRGSVDTAPLLERDFARLAGLGWFGKNTMLIDKRLGSWFFLAALLVDIELDYDEAHSASHCGTCTRCLDACPTRAFVAPYVLDARRCISYLTIEHRGPIAEEVRTRMGEWLFGCDICQEVCPWNRKAPVTREPAFLPQPELSEIDAAELLSLSEEDFERRFGHTALSRPGRAGLVRNAAIVVGNSASERDRV